MSGGRPDCIELYRCGGPLTLADRRFCRKEQHGTRSGAPPLLKTVVAAAMPWFAVMIVPVISPDLVIFEGP